MLANETTITRHAANILCEAASAILDHNNKHHLGFLTYFAPASFSGNQIPIPDCHSALANQRDIARLRSTFGDNLASLGLEVGVTTVDLYNDQDDNDHDIERDLAKWPEGSDARIDIVDPNRFLAILPHLIDIAASTPFLSKALLCVVESLRFQLSDNERPHTTALLREKLQPCGFELLAQFQRLDVPNGALLAIAQHLSP